MLLVSKLPWASKWSSCLKIFYFANGSVENTACIIFLYWCCNYSVLWERKCSGFLEVTIQFQNGSVNKLRNESEGEAFIQFGCWVGVFFNLKDLRILTNFRNSKNVFENGTHMKYLPSSFSYDCDDKQI